MPLVSTLLKPVVAFLLVAALFWVMERIVRRRSASPPWRRAGFWTDCAWWMLTPLVTRTITRVGAGVAVFAIAWVTLGHPVQRDVLVAFLARETWASGLPLVAEIGLTLVMADLLGYWIHRLFHRGWLWRSHAVHHSSERLDWLAAVRVHPLNDLLGGVVRVTVLVLLGFRPTVLAGVVPFLTAYALVLHADVPWTFGRVGRLLASPVFHRWHHARDVADVNFGGFFTVWDHLFGTFHLPADAIAPPTGVREPVPSSLAGQLFYPFARKSPPIAAAPVSPTGAASR